MRCFIKVRSYCAAVCLSLFAVFSSLSAETFSSIDANYTKMLLRLESDSDWEALGNQTVPLSRHRLPILAMMDRLKRFVPESFLEKEVSFTFPSRDSNLTLSDLVADPARYRGLAMELRGLVVHVENIPLEEQEQKILGIPEVYRCRFLVGEDDYAEILTSFAPSTWERETSIRERAALTGIYIKRVLPTSISGKPDPIPLLVTSRIRWYPKNFLGDLGMDVGSLEQVPCLKISDIDRNPIEVVPGLRLLDRNEIVRRAFRFTDADRDPFYGLLKASKLTPSGLIEQEGKKEAEKEGRRFVSAIELFNEPEKHRGRPVLLHGVAKRVLKTEVEDKEVRELFGITEYYQIYLYTDDSQGNPIVVCVSSLPEEMPIGSDPDYSQRVSVGAFPYKTWIYETSATVPHGDKQKPGYAPLLVGRAPFWFPQSDPAAHPGKGTAPHPAVSFLFFAALILAWFVLRRFKRRPPIKFELK